MILDESSKLTIDIWVANPKYKCEKCSYETDYVPIQITMRDNTKLNFCGVCWGDWLKENVGQVKLIEEVK